MLFLALGSPCARAPSRSPSFHSQLPPGPLGFSFTGCENWTRPPKKQVHGKGGEADTAQVELIHQLTDWVVWTVREFPALGKRVNGGCDAAKGCGRD